MLLVFNVPVLRDPNCMFVTTPAPFVFLTGQPQKKGDGPNTDR